MRVVTEGTRRCRGHRGRAGGAAGLRRRLKGRSALEPRLRSRRRSPYGAPYSPNGHVRAQKHRKRSPRVPHPHSHQTQRRAARSGENYLQQPHTRQLREVPEQLQHSLNSPPRVGQSVQSSWRHKRPPPRREALESRRRFHSSPQNVKPSLCAQLMPPRRRQSRAASVPPQRAHRETPNATATSRHPPND